MICANELTTMKCTKRAILSDLVVCLAPFAPPHISEELWHALGNITTVFDAQWPQWNEEYLKEDAFTYAVSFNGKSRYVLEFPADATNADIEKKLFWSTRDHRNGWMGKYLRKLLLFPKKIVNVVFNMGGKLPEFSLKRFYVKDYLTIFLGTFMYALGGVTQFIMPHKFVMGGLTGVGVLINYAFGGVPVSIMVLVMNAVLLLIAFRVLGSEFLVKTIVGVASLTFFIGMFESLQWQPIMTSEPLMAGLIGSIVAGAGGVGLVMSVNGSSGGTDIIVLVINKYRHITPGRTMLLVDLAIVASSFLIFRSIETIVFGIIIIAVMSTSVDWMLNGIRQSVQFFLFFFEKKYDEIATQINLQLHRGCTVLDGMDGTPKNRKRCCL